MDMTFWLSRTEAALAQVEEEPGCSPGRNTARGGRAWPRL